MPTKDSAKLRKLVVKIFDEVTPYIHFCHIHGMDWPEGKNLVDAIMVHVEAHTAAQVAAADTKARIDELDGLLIGAYHAPFNSPETKYDVLVKQRIAELKEGTDKKQTNIVKYKSLCGCPMCEFHTEAYRIAHLTTGQKERE